MASPQLIVTPEAAELGLVATYHTTLELSNKSSCEAFDELKRAAWPTLIEYCAGNPIETDSIVQGFRELRIAVGHSPRKYPCSIEGLVGCLQRRSEIPTINLAVDIYNLISLETRLTLGAHDLDRVAGNITLRLARGDEHFVPLGSTDPESVHAGEYCYVDDQDEVLCRLDYKQCDATKLSESTSRCLFIVQGNANTSQEYLKQAKDRLVELLERFCGG